MGEFQFDIQLVPNAAVSKGDSDIEIVVSEDGLETSGWWVSNQPSSNYQEIISSSFGPIESSIPDILRWGAEDEILVEVFAENGVVEGVSARIDVRQVDYVALGRLSALAESLQSCIYVMSTKCIISPDTDSLLQAVQESKAFAYANLTSE